MCNPRSEAAAERCFQVGFDTHTSILAGTQNVCRDWERQNDANRARVWIHLAVASKTLLFQVDTAVAGFSSPWSEKTIV